MVSAYLFWSFKLVFAFTVWFLPCLTALARYVFAYITVLVGYVCKESALPVHTVEYT